MPVITDPKSIKRPYLIQRGTMRHGVLSVSGIDSIVVFDYMGAAEFEFGALPKALRAMLVDLPKLGTHATGIRGINGEVYAICEASVKDEVVAILKQLAISDQHFDLHERTDFKDALAGQSTINFWWDIENNWMAVVGPRGAGNIMKALASSPLRRPSTDKPEPAKSPIGRKVAVSCCGRWTNWYTHQPAKICSRCGQIMKTTDPNT